MVERLIAYRRPLRLWLAGGKTRIYSHELADLNGVTPAVVRRDLMTIGYAGSPARGYAVTGLVEKLDALLDVSRDGGIVLVGAGTLGRAMLSHFCQTHPDFRVSAVFDSAPENVGCVIEGFPCQHIATMRSVLDEHPAAIAILAVPGSAAQAVADELVATGVRGLVNLTSTRLGVPPEVYVEDMNISVLVEKVAFLARQGAARTELCVAAECARDVAQV